MKDKKPQPRRFDDYGDELKFIAVGMKLKNPPIEQA